MSYYETTPSAMNAFSVYFTERFDDRDIFDVQTAWQSFWRGPRPKYTGDVSQINIDIIRGNKRMSVLVKRGQRDGDNLDQKNMQDAKSTNVARLLPLAEEKSTVLANELNFRRPGENPVNSGVTQMDRARGMSRDKYAEHTRKIVRLNEYLASYAMQNGTHPYIIGDTDDEIDFYRNASCTFASAGEWDDTGGDPITDLMSGVTAAITYGKKAPNMVIMSPEAAVAFVGNSLISGNADVRNYKFIEAGMYPVLPQFQKFIDGGFAYLGRIKLPNGYELSLFVDNGTYDDADGDSAVYITASSILFCHSDARYDLYVGPFEKFPMTDSERSFIQSVLGISPNLTVVPSNTPSWALPPGSIDHDLYFTADRTALTLRTQTSFIFAPVHTDSIVVMTGCAL